MRGTKAGTGGLNPRSENHMLFGFLLAINETPTPMKMLDFSGALENYCFL